MMHKMYSPSTTSSKRHASGESWLSLALRRLFLQISLLSNLYKLLLLFATALLFILLLLPSSISFSSPSKYHVIISTECNLYNEWQSYLFLYSLNNLKFNGKVTRIVSCSDSAWNLANGKFEQFLKRRFNNYREYWTPNYNPYYKSGDHYAPRNRPHSLLHLINRFGNEFIDDQDIVVLMDPDQLFLMDQWKDFGVTEGNPIAAQYSSGTDFLRWANAHCHGACDNVENPEELQIGAPYIVHAKDFKKIVPLWVEAMELIRKHNSEQGGWLSDMYAYTIAALRLKIRHKCLPMMVSSPDDDREPWNLVDLEDKTPLFVLHYCQAVKINDFVWNKHQLRESFDFLDCKNRVSFPELSKAQFAALGTTEQEIGHLASTLPKFRDHPNALALSREDMLKNRHIWLYSRILPLAKEALLELQHSICSS